MCILLQLKNVKKEFRYSGESVMGQDLGALFPSTSFTFNELQVSGF